MNYIDSKSNIYINFENSYYDEEFTDYNYSLYYTNFLYSILENPVKVYLGAGINLGGSTFNYTADIINKVESVEKDDISKIVRFLMKEKPTLAIVGPVESSLSVPGII